MTTDEPTARQATASDGASIAYWTIGSGSPFLLHLAEPIWPSIPTIMREPTYAAYWRAMAGDGTLVMLDHRGVGASEAVPAHDLNDLIADIAAVIEDLGESSIVLVAAGLCNLVGAEFAAEHPHRVSHLVLYEPPESVATLTPEWADLIDVTRRNHAFGVETTWQMAVKWGRDSDVRRFARQVVRENPHETYLAYLSAIENSILSDSLARIAMPTLILGQADHSFLSLQMAQEASRLSPLTSLHVLQGDLTPSREFGRQVRAAIVDFADLKGDDGAQGDVRTILFTDVEDSTDLVVQHGDAKYRALLADHERLVREALAEHGGNEIKTIGDSFMCWFSSASAAIEAATAMQRKISDHYGDGLRIRIGIHAGEPIVDDDDLWGISVNRASRIMGKADGGQIFVSQVVMDLVEGKGYLFSDAGEFALKGYERAVHLFDVAWEAE